MRLLGSDSGGNSARLPEPWSLHAGSTPVSLWVCGCMRVANGLRLKLAFCFYTTD